MLRTEPGGQKKLKGDKGNPKIDQDRQAIAKTTMVMIFVG